MKTDSDEFKKILVITGDTGWSDRLKSKLTDLGFRVRTADNADMGLRAIADVMPHLVLLDVTLNGATNGYEVLVRKTREPLLAKIPVFFMSTNGLPINMRDIPENSVEEFIVAMRMNVDDVVKRIDDYFGVVPEEEGKDTNVGSRKKLLWVEDDKLIGTILGKKLTASGFDIIHTRTGDEALDQLKQVVPDALIVDLLLPGMSGFDFLQHVKGDPRMKKVPIMVLSNLSKQSDVEKAKMLGTHKFLVKAAVSLDQIVEEMRGMF